MLDIDKCSDKFEHQPIRSGGTPMGYLIIENRKDFMTHKKFKLPTKSNRTNELDLIMMSVGQKLSYGPLTDQNKLYHLFYETS